MCNYVAKAQDGQLTMKLQKFQAINFVEQGKTAIADSVYLTLNHTSWDKFVNNYHDQEFLSHSLQPPVLERDMF